MLLDTCVLSELQRPHGNATVLRTVQERNDDDLFISVISIGEIIKGVALLDEGNRKQSLQRWLQMLESSYSPRLLPIDLETVRIWGEMTAAARKVGYAIPVSDGLIAATALRHGLYVMTRNIKDFEYAGVMLCNPWADSSI